MPRVRPADRFDQLVRAAAQVFIQSGGFHKAQIADIARALGVAKGTVYLVAESKEALFAAALEHADTPGLIAPPHVLPIRSEGLDHAASVLRKRLKLESQFPTLRAARDAVVAGNFVREASAVVAEIYSVLARNKVVIKMLTVTAAELPQLAELWFKSGRGQLLSDLTAYLTRRTGDGCIAICPTPDLTARAILETISWFAVHRHFDPQPQAISDDDALAEVILATVARLRSQGEPNR